MFRVVIGIFLILHGLVHLIGFVVPWQLVTTVEFPYSTMILADKVDVGATGIRLIGLLWLLAAIGYVIAGIGLFTSVPWWMGLTLWVTVFSLVLCITGWPGSQFGVYIDVILLGYLLFGGRFGWLPKP
jgi:hypothetical protein